MKNLARGIAFAAALVWAGTARAEIGTIDAVPASTLLLPYFEVSVGSSDGINTYFTINNASASSALAHVQLWTDESVPTLNFDIYLTGYDVEIVDIGKIFRNGRLPRTADAGSDPTDTISQHGGLSQDINFPGASGPCDGATLYTNPAIGSLQLKHLRRAHRGRNSPTLGGCASARYPDGKARGYITVDSVTQCTVLAPSDAAYFSGSIADNRNILWGDYQVVDPAHNASFGSPLVHIESCIPGNGFVGYVGNGAGLCPFMAGDYTFYGRYAAAAGQDQREPLPTTFATRYVNGGIFTGGTDLYVWRDAKATEGAHACAADPTWFPLDQELVVAFDEQENPIELCASQECFPLETQRVSTLGGSAIGDDIVPPATFGWLFLDLNHTGSGPFTNVAQSWVAAATRAEGRFDVGQQAIAIDSAVAPGQGGGVMLPP